ncbi:hypothetical protein niasHS_013169 [Heterodera schachtii]|uniref:G-patch domain-containing protein n=1 Tax=Heterodera schachtii TaxID=97005 RepID=A0ABD2IH45_HETSC
MGDSNEFFTEEFEFDQTDFECAMGRRKFKRQTKEQEIYGIWAEEEDDQRPSFQHGKKRPNDSAPVSFVAGGVKVGSKTQLADGNLQEDEEESEISAVETPPEKRPTPSTFVPSTPSTSGVGAQVFAGMRSSKFQSGGGMTDTTWIKAGKGSVVMQMMQKMGYQPGKGLGKEKQGIVEPVQAFARPGRGAVGAYGSEVKGPKFGESAAEAQARINNVDIPTDAENAVQRGQWKKSNGANKVKVHYKTMVDVLSESGEPKYDGFAKGAGEKIKIIDLTGPERKEYQDYSSFSRRAKMPIIDGDRPNFNIPELPHNLNTLLDLSEEEILKTDKEVRHLKNQNEALISEEKRILEESAESQFEFVRLQELEQLVSKFCVSAEESSLDECKKLFQKLHKQFEAEFKMYGLDALAMPIVLPKIKRYFMEWDPLNPEQTFFGFSMMSEWKDLLGDSKGGALFKHFDNSSSTLSAFDFCIWHGWMPNLRRTALEWSPRSNGPVMISLVQKWMQVLPGWILENLLEQILIPRIREQIDLWDPITDTVPIESWLLPWHSLMGDRLLPAYASVRQKLAKGLRNWYPGDRSAIECIRPWKEVFSSGIIHTFIGMNILPKLEKALQSIDLISTDYFDQLELFDWMDFVGGEPIGKILANAFFPRYYDYLRSQLNSPMLSVQELERVKKNYMNWKNLFPQEIISQQVIMAELKRALMLIGQAQSRLTGAPIPGMHFQHPLPRPATPLFSVPPINTPFVQLPPTNFKQLVESTAVTNGIQFFPQRSKFQDGKQVYMFGIHSIYIDGTLLFQYNPPRRQWLPVSLNQLVEMSKG